MKELSIEQKAKRYDETLERAKKYLGDCMLTRQEYVEKVFPQLKESKESWDEKIRKALIKLVKQAGEGYENVIDGVSIENAISWLEKQGEKSNWKPSKDEMDVLYGLAYITNQYDEHKEEVVTRLYQDLKREFFNGSSYENMFPNTEDGVRRRSTIQILEYARSLDTYNQYGKADIDKNIAWLKKQGELTDINPSEFDLRLNKLLKQFETLPKEELASSLSFYLNVVQNDGTYKDEEKQGEQKPNDKVEPKFHEGDWIITNKNHIWYVDETPETTSYLYRLINQYGKVEVEEFEVVDKEARLWTIQDAKDGDVLATDDWVFIFEKFNTDGKPVCCCHYDELGFAIDVNTYISTGSTIRPATKEQRDALFAKMKEDLYEWDVDKKELKNVEQKKTPIEGEFPYDNPSDTLEGEIENIFGKLNIEGIFSATKEGFREVITHFVNYIKQQDDEEIVEPNTAWSEEDNLQLQAAIDICKSSGHTITSDWLKSLRPQNTWKPSDRELGAILTAVGDERQKGSDVAKELRKIYQQLKKLREE